MLKGDVQRFYEQLRKCWPDPSCGQLEALDHVREIYRYYEKLDPAERRLLLAWAKKEEAGIGLIPMILTGMPMITLIFGPLIQAYVRSMAAFAWLAVWGFGALGLAVGFYIHQRQRAFTTLHVQLLEQLDKATPPPAPDRR